MGLLRFLYPFGFMGRVFRHASFFTDVIEGRAYVEDADGIRLWRRRIRLHGIDAPEMGQMATLWNGNEIDYGRYVKSKLIDKIGGRWVRVSIKDYDQYGRIVGVVECDSIDICEWLVCEGLAIAAYSEDYRAHELEAKKEKRGMWRMKFIQDPRVWRAIRRKAE